MCTPSSFVDSFRKLNPFHPRARPFFERLRRTRRNALKDPTGANCPCKNINNPLNGNPQLTCDAAWNRSKVESCIDA